MPPTSSGLPADQDSLSGQGLGSPIPSRIPRRNWAPTLLGPLWLVFNFPHRADVYAWIAKALGRTRFSAFDAWDMGVTGNALSWQLKQWSSLDGFIRVQRRWSSFALTIGILCGAGLLLGVVAVLHEFVQH
jgi:hypothetical protein